MKRISRLDLCLQVFAGFVGSIVGKPNETLACKDQTYMQFTINYPRLTNCLRYFTSGELKWRKALCLTL